MRSYYRARQVRYLKADWHWSTRYNDENMIAQQQEWSLDLVRHMRLGKEVWFLDETSTHLWAKQSKVWRPAPQTAPFHLTLPQKRGKSMTIIGVICATRNLFLW